jgi:hypothetical protein
MRCTDQFCLWEKLMEQDPYSAIPVTELQRWLQME